MISHHLLQDNELEELLLFFYIYTQVLDGLQFSSWIMMPCMHAHHYTTMPTAIVLHIKKLPPTLFGIKIKILGFL
jgi:hypothetical protein